VIGFFALAPSGFTGSRRGGDIFLSAFLLDVLSLVSDRFSFVFVSFRGLGRSMK
jgi:hypothetical protein